MHELAVSRSILQIVLDHTGKNGAHKVRKIFLKIGEMRNLEEDWIQRYFNQISKGSNAENAIIHVIKVPVVFICKICHKEFYASFKEDRKILCSHCNGFDYDLLSGREFIIDKIDVE
jgi:hydrogenase nickel incorporation protein HypA/HybF